jgi:hypothetical protein
MKRLLSILFATVLLAGGFVLPAQAELQSFSPGLDANGFPLWFQDANGLRVGPCTDVAVCFEGIAPPAFPDPLFEQIYYAAEIALDGAPGAGVATGRVIMAIEGFPEELTLAPIVDNAIVIDLRDLTPNATYTVTTPFGPPIQVIADAAGRARGGANACVEGLPCPFATALTGPIGPFLRPAAAPGGTPLLPFDPDPLAPGPLFLQDVVAADLTGGDFVTGAPGGKNFVTVVGPGVNATVDKFILVGQLPDILDRRAELQTRNGKFQVTGTTTLPATTTLTITGGTGPAFNAVPLGTAIVQADGTFRSTVRAPRGFPAPPALGQVNGIMINPGVAGQATVSPLVIR